MLVIELRAAKTIMKEGVRVELLLKSFITPVRIRSTLKCYYRNYSPRSNVDIILL